MSAGISEPSQTVLENTPGRVLKFVTGVGTTIPIRAILAAQGYTQEDHDEGWELLKLASGYAISKSPTSDADVMNAIALIDGWDEKGIRRVKTILKRHHQEQYEFVCTDLEPGKGNDSVLAVAKLLERINALKNSPEREATREEDHKALAALAKRKLDDEVWAKLRSLVDTVQKPVIREDDTTVEDLAKARHQALLNLHGWFEEWSQLARDEISRRSYLIRLGLAQRKSRGQETTDPISLAEDTPDSAPDEASPDDLPPV
jgi:hypothetical protein